MLLMLSKSMALIHYGPNKLFYDHTRRLNNIYPSLLKVCDHKYIIWKFVFNSLSLEILETLNALSYLITYLCNNNINSIDVIRYQEFIIKEGRESIQLSQYLAQTHCIKFGM